jgi:hypothetical protein
MSLDAKITFCNDDALGYRRSLTPYKDSEALVLDASYRLAHLPLVNPAHPDVISSALGKPYAMGVHQRVHSLVLPIPAEALEQSVKYQALQTVLQKGPVAEKLAWDLIGLRRDKLHATLCGSLGEGESAPVLASDLRKRIKAIQPFEVEVRGLFSGNINIGRLYLKAYPEKREGQNMVHLIQRALGRKETDLYLMGLHNLTDHLNPDQARWLFDVIAHWWDSPILRFTARELWLLSSRDDLVLDSRIEERFDLKSFHL